MGVGVQGPDRVKGMPLAVPLRVAGRRAGSVGPERADYVPLSLGEVVALAAAHRAALYRRPVSPALCVSTGQVGDAPDFETVMAGIRVP